MKFCSQCSTFYFQTENHICNSDYITKTPKIVCSICNKSYSKNNYLQHQKSKIHQLKQQRKEFE